MEGYIQYFISLFLGYIGDQVRYFTLLEMTGMFHANEFVSEDQIIVRTVDDAGI